MNHIGKPERVTQNRIIDLFVNKLGYKYLGEWSEREGNSNIEEAELSALWRRGQGGTFTRPRPPFLYQEDAPMRRPK